MAVNMVHIHHEGGGAPTTAAGCERFRHGGYCYGIGTDTFARWLAPEDNYATADWNGRDLTLCFSGDRHTGYEVTDHDIQVIHNAFMDSYNRGEVTATPQVVAHRDAGGSNATACPGDKAMRRMGDIAAACRAGAQPQPEPEPEDDDMPVYQSASAVAKNGKAYLWVLFPDGTIHNTYQQSGGGWKEPWGKFSNGPFDGGLTAWANDDGRMEVAAHHKTRGMLHKWELTPNGAWSDWADYI